MQGFLDYFTPNGQLVSMELGKGQSHFGQAVLEWQPNKATWSVAAAGPNVGLKVNGGMLPPGARPSLNHLDTVTVGVVNARFLRMPAPPLFKGRPCGEVFLSSRKLVMGRSEGEGLTERNRQTAEERWELDPEDRSISKQQVEIQRAAGGFVIHDLSRTGTYLNGAAFQSKALVPGDRFKIGSYFFEFTGTSIRCVDQVSGARVEGHGLVRVVPHEGRTKVILRGVTIEIKAGEFLGVLGGSGQGKSTLMNILAGVAGATQGKILMDGAAARSRRFEPGAVGYVPQDDIVHQELTVIDAITLTARLRLAVPEEAIQALVANILQRLGLEKQLHTPVHRLSGGQRKRVNIATELLARPPVLFLDEPTSGLDPENEETVITILQNLRRTGQTVVCTTHSLHKAYLFDRIAFIHEGRLMFLGTQDEARSHFLEINEPAGAETSGPSVKLERIYKLLGGNADAGVDPGANAEWWEQKFATSPLAPFRPNAPPPERRVIAPLRRQERPGFLKTTKVLIQTQWRILRADPRNWKSLILQAAGIGLLAGWVGLTDPEFRFFACLIATLWFGCSNAAQTITRELPIFRRERSAGLNLHPYILSKTVFLSLISWLQVLMLLASQALPVYVGAVVGRAHDPSHDLFPGTITGMGLFGAAFALAGVVGVMIGLSLSAHARTTTQATLWVPLVLIPQILFSGFVVSLPEMPAAARLSSYFVPSASAQRLLDAGNIAGKYMPLMTDKTEVPMFFWTDFERYKPVLDPETGEPKSVTNLKPFSPTKKVRHEGEEVEMKYRELDEYTTAWQNAAANFSKIGQVKLPTYEEQYDKGGQNSGSKDADGDASDSKPYRYKRPDVQAVTGLDLSISHLAGTSILSLLAWVVACYGIIWAGLTLAQPETLHPAWARWLNGRSKGGKARSRPSHG